MQIFILICSLPKKEQTGRQKKKTHKCNMYNRKVHRKLYKNISDLFMCVGKRYLVL